MILSTSKLSGEGPSLKSILLSKRIHRNRMPWKFWKKINWLKKIYLQKHRVRYSFLKIIVIISRKNYTWAIWESIYSQTILRILDKFKTLFHNWLLEWRRVIHLFEKRNQILRKSSEGVCSWTSWGFKLFAFEWNPL